MQSSVLPPDCPRVTLVGLRVQVLPVVVTERLTVPVNPFRLFRFTFVDPPVPFGTSIELGLAVMLKSVKENGTVRV